jgi:hypothetical protein
MTEERNILPEPLGCCPVCKESWDAGGGKSKILVKYEMMKHRVEGCLNPVLVGDPLGMPISYLCPFCRTEWEV